MDQRTANRINEHGAANLIPSVNRQSHVKPWKEGHTVWACKVVKCNWVGWLDEEQVLAAKNSASPPIGVH